MRLIAFTFLIACCALALPELSHAQGLASAMCKIIDGMKGEIGKAAAALAIIFVGIGAFFGKVNWGMVLITLIGIYVLFNAEAIIRELTPTNASCAQIAASQAQSQGSGQPTNSSTP